MSSKASQPQGQRSISLTSDDASIQENHRLGSNSVRTSKYTLLTFIPLNLFTQFSKAPNIYFLVIMYMQTISLISISGGKPAMAAPLVLVVLVSMVKDAFEDYKRAKQDKEENTTKTQKLDQGVNQFKTVEWRSTYAGDILKIS